MIWRLITILTITLFNIALSSRMQSKSVALSYCNSSMKVSCKLMCKQLKRPFCSCLYSVYGPIPAVDENGVTTYIGDDYANFDCKCANSANCH